MFVSNQISAGEEGVDYIYQVTNKDGNYEFEPEKRNLYVIKMDTESTQRWVQTMEEVLTYGKMSGSLEKYASFEFIHVPENVNEEE